MDNICEWIMQGKTVLVDVVALLTTIVSGMVAMIRMSSLLECSKIEVAFMTRYEQTKYKVYTYVFMFVISTASEAGIAYGVSNLRCLIEMIQKPIVIIAVAFGMVISFLLVIICSNINKPVSQKIGQTSFYVFWVTISMVNACVSHELYQHGDYLEIFCLALVVAVMLTIGIYMLTYKAYDPNLAKAIYESENGDVLCIYMANDKGSVYVGREGRVRPDCMSCQLKGVSYFENKGIKIYSLNYLYRKLIDDNREEDLKRALVDDDYRKQLEKEYKM